MYCVQCGVKLADTEKICPLCQTVCFHPDFVRPVGEELYPQRQYPQPQVRPIAVPVVLTVLTLIPVLIVLLCDLQIHRTLTWSGYSIGALIAVYVAAILPLWFRKPNPVIFVPCAFAALAGYLLYIDSSAGSGWFLPFALPVVGGVCGIVTTLAALLRYVRRGKLYIFGGCTLATGLFMPVMEFLMNRTFHLYFSAWSVYPFVTLVILGGYLIFLGICRPAREMMERKFFI